MQRLAQCACGTLKVLTSGEPDSVVACHCTQCQRRTGSVFGVGAYFPEERVTVSGNATQYVRFADSGNKFVFHFCPACGTCVYWYGENKPGIVGVAVGAFADASFPAPVRSVWERSKHPWVRMDCAQQRFVRGRDSDSVLT